MGGPVRGRRMEWFMKVTIHTRLYSGSSSKSNLAHTWIYQFKQRKVNQFSRKCIFKYNELLYSRQRGRINVEPGMRQSGCQVNARSTFTRPKGSPVWKYGDILRFMEVYSLTLHAGTFYRQPYTPMVASILCQYHFCIGKLGYRTQSFGLFWLL